MVRVQFQGYFCEKLPSGNYRHRVRIEGNKRIFITLPCGPENPKFQELYFAARAGIKPNKQRPEIAPTSGTVGWLATAYIAHLRTAVDQGQASPLTLKQRLGMAERLMDHTSTSGTSTGRVYRTLPMVIPHHELIVYRDSLMSTPGQCHNTFKFLKAMYKWAVERGHCDINPAAAIKVEYKNQGGATPWTLDDLAKFRKAHPAGTMAHLCLTLFMFSACRISEAVNLGRNNELQKNGNLWLEWEPEKKGAKRVTIPVLAPLEKAIRAQSVVGSTYLLTERGKPFASPEALRNRLNKWCKAAGIEGRSSHGIRKAAGHLLALNGATQYEIMAVHGHAQASTSQIYTKDVERTQLAEKAVSRLAGMDW